MVSYDEIKENNYNLSVSIYVEGEVVKDVVDIESLNTQIEEIAARENTLREEISDIIAERRNSVMSDLEKLIQEHCPNGVKHVKVGSVAEVGTGSSNGNEATDDGEYPFFVRSQTVKAKNDYEYDEEAIIIPGEGGVGDIFHYVNGKRKLQVQVGHPHE